MTSAVPTDVQDINGQYFDGHSAQRHSVTVAVSRDKTGLVIDTHSPGGTPLIWPLDRLRQLADQAHPGTLILTLHAATDDETARDAARLVLNDPGMVAWVRAKAPKLTHRDVRPGTTAKILSRLALAVAAIGVILFMVLPRMSDYLAERMPLETEVRFGKSVVRQMERFLGPEKGGSLICTDPKGKAALDKMLSRLTDGRGMTYDVNLLVFNHPMVNAFAAPGGQVVLIRGLLDQAESADEVAAVLAHELGHVEARDATRLSLRAAGSAGIISIILGDVSGGTLIGLVGDHLLRSAYTRDAEGAADRFALDMLNKAGVSSRGMAGFFQRIGGKSDLDLPEYLSSHPLSEARAQRAAQHSKDQQATTPVLNTDDWAALKNICKG